MELLKENKESAPDLSEIKKELKKQEEWIRQLHSNSVELHSNARFIKESTVKHKKEIVENIDRIGKWIEYLNDSNISLKRELSELRASLRKTLRADFEAYHNTLSEYLRLKLNEEQLKKETLKSELLKELRNDLSSLFESRKPQKETINNAETGNNVKNIMHYNADNELSGPEKDLLTLLFNENKPLTYENIAKRQNKSINSIRVYMNSLKSKKNVIEEYKTPNGSKVFSIKNSALVKTLFNP